MTAEGETVLTITEELDALPGVVEDTVFLCRRPQMVQFRVGDTWSRTINAKFIIPDDYPAVCVAIELDAPFLPVDLLDKLEDRCTKLAKQENGKPHLVKVVEYLSKTVRSNVLLPAWQELKDLKEILGPEDKLSQKENGTVTVHIKHNNYFAKIEAKLTRKYPEDGMQIRVLESNFHESLVMTYGLQASESVRLLTLGVQPAEAIRRSLGQEAKKFESEELGPKGDLSSNGLLELRRDMQWLKERKAFEESGDGKAKHRRAMRRIDAREMEREMELLKTDDEIPFERPKALPSLLAAMSYLSEVLVHGLPEVCCTSCGNRMFPKDPTRQEKLFVDAKSGKRAPRMPERVICGHWFHYKCLEKFLHEPDDHGSFRKKCKICGLEVEHMTLWKDVGAREKKWAKEVEKQREMSEIADFLGV
eukprot:m.305216 g.305216  ORF g.305216 m.305216 type:complete len:419 (-) comp16446_c4_seq46:1144-2400(-)